MTQEQKRLFLIKYLLSEYGGHSDFEIPQVAQEQKKMLRALLNVRPAKPISPDFLRVQDLYLREETIRKGITDISDLEPVENGVYLWQGDITALRCDAVVNAANSALLGCFFPNHGCIDNCIHTYAGVQLRLKCAEIMEKQGFEEPAGNAKITPAYNLPSNYILHTVGPVVSGKPNGQDRETLARCYRSCLELAEQNNLKSVAFCCISTGEFHFPRAQAARIAVDTVRKYLSRANGEIKIIFNVFKDEDYEIYSKLLGRDRQA